MSIVKDESILASLPSCPWSSIPPLGESLTTGMGTYTQSA